MLLANRYDSPVPCNAIENRNALTIGTWARSFTSHLRSAHTDVVDALPKVLVVDCILDEPWDLVVWSCAPGIKSIGDVQDLVQLRLHA